ncbi:hypothetical protein FA95DRAFT_537231 [Auriscalpium vulgare]|uniref:Uncharacterized protein n=1 Tax=Auriscalpium vulgare TaxID=40419 RepID=A0ACB8REQ1_9AGAM|nr:hypothetical protein FA95DRAFT_537231 [Auriscalpium vulgare]
MAGDLIDPSPSVVVYDWQTCTLTAILKLTPAARSFHIPTFAFLDERYMMVLNIDPTNCAPALIPDSEDDASQSRMVVFDLHSQHDGMEPLDLLNASCYIFLLPNPNFTISLATKLSFHRHATPHPPSSNTPPLPQTASCQFHADYVDRLVVIFTEDTKFRAHELFATASRIRAQLMHARPGAVIPWGVWGGRDFRADRTGGGFSKMLQYRVYGMRVFVGRRLDRGQSTLTVEDYHPRRIARATAATAGPSSGASPGDESTSQVLLDDEANLRCVEVVVKMPRGPGEMFLGYLEFYEDGFLVHAMSRNKGAVMRTIMF